MQTVISTPTINTFVIRGRVFQLLSGGKTRLRFRGVNDEWSEDVTLVAGDSLKFDRDFYNIEISSEYQQVIEIYAGYADMRRARTDLAIIGSSQIRSKMVEVGKTEALLIAGNRTRKKLLIKPLSGMIYVGGLGTSMNDKMPIEAGNSFTLDTQAALYAQIAPNAEQEKIDVRIMEELD